MSTTNLFLVSLVALWVLVLALYYAVYLLYRYIGLQQQGGVPPKRSGMSDVVDAVGPRLGEKVDLLLTTIRGNTCEIGRESGQPSVLFFASEGCPGCLQVRPSFVESSKLSAAVGAVVVFRGVPEKARKFLDGISSPIVAVADPQNSLATAWKVSVTPYLVSIDSKGIVRKKGHAQNTDGIQAFFEIVLPSS